MSREAREALELEEARRHISRLELALADRTTYSVVVFTGSQKGANTTAQARGLDAANPRWPGVSSPPMPPQPGGAGPKNPNLLASAPRRCT